jgi:hypothetical protein
MDRRSSILSVTHRQDHRGTATGKVAAGKDPLSARLLSIIGHDRAALACR